jgi:hypothetical protein
VSEDQKKHIEQWLAAMGTPQQAALRGRIVMAAGDGKSEAAIAAEMKVNRKTVCLWCERFVAPRTAGAMGGRAGPRPQGHLQRGKDPGGDRRDTAVETERDDPLELSAHGGKSRLEQIDGEHLWRSHNIKPHCTKTFKLASPRLRHRIAAASSRISSSHSNVSTHGPKTSRKLPDSPRSPISEMDRG